VGKFIIFKLYITLGSAVVSGILQAFYIRAKIMLYNWQGGRYGLQMLRNEGWMGTLALKPMQCCQVAVVSAELKCGVFKTESR
jgi:hypothetical protein